MIPALGTMIGFYILTRMLDLLAGDKKMALKIFGIITIIVTIVSMVDILNAGSRVGGLSSLGG